LALRTLITERQRRVGAELRNLREQAGVSIADVSERVGMGRPHLSHIEAGRTNIPSDRLRELAAIFGRTDAPFVDALVSLSESRGKGWWSAYRKVMPQIALDLAELESHATHVQSHETLLIPGLLQTESYMRVLFRSSRPDATADELETLVRFRLDRQQILRPAAAVSFHAVIHESALRIAVGGSDVMREQLTALIRASEHPGVTIQILPFEAGAPAWLGTPFLTLSPGVQGLETVILDHPAQPLNLGDDESVARYRATFDGLSNSALRAVVADSSPDRHERRDSWGLIQHILYTH
jgi:transcriptional regulator with XRE-family HTH domain